MHGCGSVDSAIGLAIGRTHPLQWSKRAGSFRADQCECANLIPTGIDGHRALAKTHRDPGGSLVEACQTAAAAGPLLGEKTIAPRGA